MIKYWRLGILITFLIVFSSVYVSAETVSKVQSGVQNPEDYKDNNNQGAGQLLWKFKTGDRITHTPVGSDDIIYIQSGDKNLYALNAKTGDEIWRFLTIDNISKPIIIDNIIYFASGDHVYALDSKTGSEIWQFSNGIDKFNSPYAGMDGLIYTSSSGNGHTIYALDTNNGSIIWQYTRGSDIKSSKYSNEMIFVNFGKDNFLALDAKTGSEIWQFAHEGGNISNYAISNDIIFLSGRINTQKRANIYALDTRTGAKIWQTNIEIVDLYTPSITENVICIAGASQNIIGLDTQTGNVLWKFNVGQGAPTTIKASNGIFYFGCIFNNNFYAIDARSGKKIWQFTAGDYTPGWPEISDGIVYFYNVDNNIYALDAKTGSKQWQFATGGGISQLLVEDGVVYRGSEDHFVYAVGKPTSQPTNSKTSIEISPTQVASESPSISSSFSIIQNVRSLPTEISFMDQSTGNPKSWLWDFGDGTNDNTQNPTHLYTKEGTYTVSLSVSDGNVISKPTIKQVTVSSNNPTQSYEAIDSKNKILPDLTITKFPVSYGEFRNILYDLTIINEGKDKAGKFSITYFLTYTKTNHPFMDPNAKEFVLERDDVNGMELGATRAKSSMGTFSIHKTQIPSGNYWFGVFIDSRDEIIESDEENNVMYGPEQITL